METATPTPPPVNNVKPLGRRIVVERLLTEAQRTGKIGNLYVPENCRSMLEEDDMLCRARVLEIGTAPADTFSVKVGDILLVDKRFGFPTGVENHTVIIEHEAIAIIEEVPDEAVA